MLRYLFAVCLTLGLFVGVGFFSNAQELCTGDGDCDDIHEYCADSVCTLCTDNEGIPVRPDADGDFHNRISCGGDDCDDSRGFIYPGADEVCDTAMLDEDCDPDTLGFRDQDGDGYNDAACCNRNPDFGEEGEPEYNCGDDCNDMAGSIYPDATEFCNNLDDNCSGVADDGVNVIQYRDMDSDGYGMGFGELMCPGTPGYSLLGNDCDDMNVAIKPGAMMCDAYNPNMIRVCNAIGLYDDELCADECVPQPNGTGYCQQSKVKKFK